MTIFGMSEQFPVQIPIGNVIEFASIFFERYPAKFDDCAIVYGRARAKKGRKASFRASFLNNVTRY